MNSSFCLALCNTLKTNFSISYFHSLNQFSPPFTDSIAKPYNLLIHLFIVNELNGTVILYGFPNHG